MSSKIQYDFSCSYFHRCFRKLPKELLLRAFSYLDVVSLCRCAQVGQSIVCMFVFLCVCICVSTVCVCAFVCLFVSMCVCWWVGSHSIARTTCLHAWVRELLVSNQYSLSSTRVVWKSNFWHSKCTVNLIATLAKNFDVWHGLLDKLDHQREHKLITFPTWLDFICLT